MMQYRADLGSIRLKPQYPTTTTTQRREPRDYYFTDIATTANGRQTSSYYTTTTATRQALEDSSAQRVEVAHYCYASPLKPKDLHRSTPVSSLFSPPNPNPNPNAAAGRGWSPVSSQSDEASEGTTTSDDASLESPETAAAMQSSFQIMNSFQQPGNHHHHHHHQHQHHQHHHGFMPSAKLSSAGSRVPRASAAERIMSGEVAHMLQVLESALLEDDGDEDLPALSSSMIYRQQRDIATSDRSWADAFMVDILHDAVAPPMPQNNMISSAQPRSLESSQQLTPSPVLTSTSDSARALRQSASATEQQQQQHNDPPTSCSLQVMMEEDSTAQAQLGVESSLDSTRRLKRMLVECAEVVGENNFVRASALITELNQQVSIIGDPMQRLAAYMVEGLVARMVSSGGGFYRTLKCKEAPVGDLLSAMQVLYQVCPYFKFGYMAANGAIAEAFQNEEQCHIVDFEINQGVQWCTLIQALAERPGGPPHLRITGIEAPSSSTPSSEISMHSGGAGGAGGSLEAVGDRLRKLAKSVGVPFMFHALEKKSPEVQARMLERRQGEALAVNFALQLHHMPDESVCMTNPRDRLLQMVKGLNPKVVTLVEQEANTNTAPFLPRFVEAMNYYSAVFQSLDITLARDSRDRINVEQQCLARDIVNVIACEGAERVERHEMLGKWRSRMTMAGFRPRPLSSRVNYTIKLLLKAYSENYKLKEEGGALFLGWMNRSLVVASAWH